MDEAIRARKLFFSSRVQDSHVYSGRIECQTRVRKIQNARKNPLKNLKKPEDNRDAKDPPVHVLISVMPIFLVLFSMSECF